MAKLFENATQEIMVPRIREDDSSKTSPLFTIYSALPISYCLQSTSYFLLPTIYKPLSNDYGPLTKIFFLNSSRD